MYHKIIRPIYIFLYTPSNNKLVKFLRLFSFAFTLSRVKFVQDWTGTEELTYFTTKKQYCDLSVCQWSYIYVECNYNELI